MTSTHKEIHTQLTRLSAVFDPLQPKTTADGQVNPKYTAALQVYLEALEPFQPWELEAGIKLALENHRHAKWPKPAELRAWCIEAQQAMKPAPPPRQMLPKPERREVSPEERERIAMQLRVLGEYQRTGNFKTLAECKAEALRRISSQSPTS